MTISIDGTDISDITIDGDAVTEVTIDGNVAWTASTQTVYESFENGDLSNYSGDTSAFSVTSSAPGTTPDGTYALSLDVNSFSSIGQTGLSTSECPQQGEPFRFSFRYGSGADSATYIGTRYAYQDENNYYWMRAEIDTGELELWETVSGSSNNLARINYTQPSGEWCDCYINWQNDDSHQIIIYDSSGTNIGEINHTNTSHSGQTSQGIRWFGAGGSHGVYADFMRSD